MNLADNYNPQDPVIVYQYTLDQKQTLLRYYSVTAHVKDDIYVEPPGEEMSNPTLSGNAQWVLFVSYAANSATTPGNEMLQVIATTGQLLQTIYCTDHMHGFTSVQWSPDQAYVAFSLVSYANNHMQPDGLYILNTSNGDAQKVLSGATYEALGWKDATHLYVTKAKGGSAQAARELDLLDITGGADRVQTVFANAGNVYWNVSLSPDGQYLYLSEMSKVSGGPAKIVVMSATGGEGKSVYSNQSRGMTEVCAGTNNTLLVSISKDQGPNNPSSLSNTGLYRMKTDGTGEMRLFSLESNGESVTAGCLHSWQTISRDGSMYAFADGDAASNKLYFGTLNSGRPPTLFADTGNTIDTATIVGWTYL